MTIARALVVAFSLSAALAAPPAMQPPGQPDNPLIDADGFLEVARETLELRKQRRITEEQFLEWSRQPGTVVLDSRGADAFTALHLDGAVNLPFSDFTEAALAAVIPGKSTRVLIYCNNNFAPSPRDMPKKDVNLALNLPTFVNLAGYGYTNVYELGPMLDPATTRLPFAGTSMRAKEDPHAQAFTADPDLPVRAARAR